MVGWEGIPPANLVMSDFHRCTWPAPLSTEDDSIARRFDAMNDERGGSQLEVKVAALRAAHPGVPLITASHFVPRTELCPEKRFLFFPPLAKAKIPRQPLRTTLHHPTLSPAAAAYRSPPCDPVGRPPRPTPRLRAVW